MARANWFQRNTGRPVQVLADCECRQYGRAGCFSCIRQPEYADRTPSVDTRIMYPGWWGRFSRHQIDERDFAFLAGVPYRPRRRW